MARLQLGGILPHGDRVHVDDAIDALVRLLQLDPLQHGAEVVAQMQAAGRLHAGKHALFECHWSPFNAIGAGLWRGARGPRKAAIARRAGSSERPGRRRAAGQEGARLAQIECPRCKHRNGVGEEAGADQAPSARRARISSEVGGLNMPSSASATSHSTSAHDGAGQHDAGQRALQAARRRRKSRAWLASHKAARH